MWCSLCSVDLRLTKSRRGSRTLSVAQKNACTAHHSMCTHNRSAVSGMRTAGKCFQKVTNSGKGGGWRDRSGKAGRRNQSFKRKIQQVRRLKGGVRPLGSRVTFLFSFFSPFFLFLYPGAQNLIFGGLNCCTISCNISSPLKKKQFLSRVQRGTPWRPLLIPFPFL